MHNDATRTSRGKELVIVNPDALPIQCAVQALRAKSQHFTNQATCQQNWTAEKDGIVTRKHSLPKHARTCTDTSDADTSHWQLIGNSLFLGSQSLQGDGVCMPHHSQNSILQASQLWQHLVTCPLHFRLMSTFQRLSHVRQDIWDPIDGSVS